MVPNESTRRTQLLLLSRTPSNLTMVGPPDPIDLRAASAASSRPPIRSPRQHIAGEAPPELSPLDAFALQSRLLARQLGESNPRTGRRMSRLPPLDASSPLIVQARRDYFRSLSNDSASSDRSIRGEQHNDGLGLKTEVEDAFGDDRPVSVHPRMSGVPPPPPVSDDVPVPELPPNLVFEKAPPEQKEETPDFSTRFEESPTPMDVPSPVVEAISTDDAVHIPPSQVATASSPTLPNSTPEISSAEQFQGESPGLAPPRPPFQKRPSSIASSFETTDEEGATPMTSSFNSLPLRKMSSGSHTSGLHPSPGPTHSKQSPSIGSEHSAVPRPFNFSRPISRVGTPGPESPYMKAAHDSYFPLAEADETAATPRSINSDSHDNTDGTPGAQSYIYSKFSLPRGKAVRPSLQPGDQVLNMWHQANSPNMLRGAPPSPPVRSRSSSSRDVTTEYNMGGTSPDQENKVGPAAQPSPNPSLPSTEEGGPSEDAPRGRTLTSQGHDEARAKTAQSTSTQDSSGTVKPRHKPSITPTSILEMSAEEHLAKGIECHESGSLSKSTYHLRLAARQHHPTAMLLYALACRHGWGMRVNEREGVEWLRKAAEYASLEIADDEGQAKEGKPVDFLQRKTRKAQFALSIYELGVSHMNGWGIEQDRGLALRCFEIAGCRFIPRVSRLNQVLTVGSVGRCGRAFRGGLLLRPGPRVQEGSEEGGQVLPDCRV